MQRRTWRALLVVGLLLGAGTMLAVNNFQSDQASNISNGVTVSPTFSDFELTVQGDTEMNLSDAFPEPHTVDVNLSEGNISLAARNGTAATINKDEIEGTWTNVTDITAGGTWIEIYPYDKQRVDVRGDLNKIAIRAVTLDDGTEDFYIDGTDSGTGTVKLYDVTANEDIAAVDVDTGAFLDAASSDANGNVTFDIPLSAHSVELNTVDAVAPSVTNPQPTGTVRFAEPTLSVDVTDGNFPNDELTLQWYVNGTLENTTTVTSNGTASATVGPFPDGTYNFTVNATDSYGLSDETANTTFQIDHYDPVHSNPDPQGQVTTRPTEISIDVNDTDFAFDGDEIEVNISLDGSQISSENITQNQTVTTSNFGTLDLGGHQFTVNSTDSYGNFQSDTFTFEIPSNITLRNETNASQIITDKNITATFYSENGEVVVQRSDSDQDGNISLAGLPNTAFVVTFSGGEYYDRRIYIDTIFEQDSIYLLNKTAYPDAIATTFVYEDRTDQFDQDETTLEIQRAVDPDNDDEFQFETVAGDFWGAAGEFPFTGQFQQRYRLVVTNRETGERRVLGTHIPRADGVKNIIVGDIVFDAENATGRVFNASINHDTNNLQIYYQDPTNGTTDLNIVVYEAGNQSNEIYNDTLSGPLGTELISVQLTDNETDTNWVVRYDGQHSSGERVFAEVITGGNSYGIPIDADILASIAYVLLTFVMSLYGPRTALAGAWAGVGFLGFVMVMQWVTVPVATITVAMLIAAGGTVYREAVPG